MQMQCTAALLDDDHMIVTVTFLEFLQYIFATNLKPQIKTLFHLLKAMKSNDLWLDKDKDANNVYITA